jgi:hypothetical protein
VSNFYVCKVFHVSPNSNKISSYSRYS